MTGAATRLAPAWRRSLATYVVVLVVTLGMYHDTATTMVGIWYRSETFTHAFLVPPIVLWLAWRRRATLLALVPRPAPWVLVPLVVVAAAWLLGEAVSVNAVTQFALVAMLVLAVPAVFGLEVAAALAFPLAFSFFMVPVGEFLLPVLMQWTADFTVAALRASGIPVYREGLRFIIPSGSWSVVEACSGVRYLIASLMVGSLFGYLNYRSPLRRWVFVGVSIAVPIVANWVRAYIIVMLGHLSDNRIATGVDHLVYGWIFFGIVIMLMFVIGARWSEPDEADAAAAAATAPVAGAAAPPAPRHALAALLTAASVAWPALAMQLAESPAGATEVRLALPESAGGWTGASLARPAWEPVYENPSAAASRIYADGSGRWVGVDLLYYRGQGPERKLVSSTNVVVRSDDRIWNPVASSRRSVATGAAQAGPLDVRETRLVGPDLPGVEARPSLRVWQLYWIGGAWTSSDVLAKLLGAWMKLRGQGDDAAVVFLFSADGESGHAERALAAFLAANRPALESALAAARDSARAP